MLTRSVIGVYGTSLQILIMFYATLVVGFASGETVRSDASVWRDQQLKRIAAMIQETESLDDRREYVAREKWLQEWKPGKMSSVPKKCDTVLAKEPMLEEIKRPPQFAFEDWQRMVAWQAKLVVIDNTDDRKKDLEDIIELASQIEESLASKLPADAHELPSPTGWALAFVRYRLGRALAYRELPVVRERWPIVDRAAYEKRLLVTYGRLIRQTQTVRPEFVLLEDRMLRRSGRKGQALRLLEMHQGVIDTKWYLKKRRDLLKELEWNLPFQEAAQIYLDAGFRDEQ